jgi:hypothetical protein
MTRSGRPGRPGWSGRSDGAGKNVDVSYQAHPSNAIDGASPIRQKRQPYPTLPTNLAHPTHLTNPTP